MFKNRLEAGEKLAAKVKESLSAGVVLGIPRGGIAVGLKVAQALDSSFDCLVIKKIRAPENPDLAIGAVSEGGVVVWDEKLCQKLGVSADYQKSAVREKLLEFERKENDFRGGQPVPVIEGKTVILVDDGIATGSTMKTALAVVRSFKPKEVIVAVPIISPDAMEEIKSLADKVIYLEVPEMFFSLDQFYEDFRQQGDEEIREMLGR